MVRRPRWPSLLALSVEGRREGGWVGRFQGRAKRRAERGARTTGREAEGAPARRSTPVRPARVVEGRRSVRTGRPPAPLDAASVCANGWSIAAPAAAPARAIEGDGGAGWLFAALPAPRMTQKGKPGCWRRCTSAAEWGVPGSSGIIRYCSWHYSEHDPTTEQSISDAGPSPLFLPLCDHHTPTASREPMTSPVLNDQSRVPSPARRA